MSFENPPPHAEHLAPEATSSEQPFEFERDGFTPEKVIAAALQQARRLVEVAQQAQVMLAEAKERGLKLPSTESGGKQSIENLYGLVAEEMMQVNQALTHVVMEGARAGINLTAEDLQAKVAELNGGEEKPLSWQERYGRRGAGGPMPQWPKGQMQPPMRKSEEKEMLDAVEADMRRQSGEQTAEERDLDAVEADLARREAQRAEQQGLDAARADLNVL